MLTDDLSRSHGSGTDRYAVLGSKHSHSFDIFICDVGGDDQDGGIGVTQLVGAVYLTDGPAFIRETLKHKKHREENIEDSSFLNPIDLVLVLHLPAVCTLQSGRTLSSHPQETAPCTGRQTEAARGQQHRC